jgi:hypothetical protein
MSEPAAPPRPLAESFFEAIQLASSAEDQMDDALLSAFGAEPYEVKTWPCGDLVYDDYDASFELRGTRDDFEPTADQLTAVWALGFDRGWICYKDGTERYVSPKTRGERKPSRHTASERKREKRMAEPAAPPVPREDNSHESRSPDGDGPACHQPQRETSYALGLSGTNSHVDNAEAGSEPADSHSIAAPPVPPALTLLTEKCRGCGGLAPARFHSPNETAAALFCKSCLDAARTAPKKEPMPDVDVVVKAYQEAQDYWSAQCFCFTSAPEQMRRDAHEQARDGFNAIVQILGPLARPVLAAEYKAARDAAKTDAALAGAAPPVPPDLRALSEKWRAKAAQIDTFHATMGTGYKACADELDAALAALPPNGEP